MTGLKVKRNKFQFFAINCWISKYCLCTSNKNQHAL